jgi:hypothetical protein
MTLYRSRHSELRDAVGRLDHRTPRNGTKADVIDDLGGDDGPACRLVPFYRREHRPPSTSQGVIHTRRGLPGCGLRRGSGWVPGFRALDPAGETRLSPQCFQVPIHRGTAKSQVSS